VSIDFTKKKQVLVIHGVQAGDDADLRQHEAIRKNVTEHLGGIAMPFETDIFKYEDINDEASFVVKKALAALTGNRIAGWIVEQTIDLAGDVAIALLKGPTYELIKERFKARILASYDRREPLFIVAHSLGTIYAFDAVNDLMKQDGLFQWDRRETRPVQGLITLGSPLALDLFERDWRSMADLVPEGKKVDNVSRLFPWINCWAPTDPIVSGSLAGLPSNAEQFARKFGDEPYDRGWDVRSRTVIAGTGHLAAHTAYWKSTDVGSTLRWMMARRGVLS
jgi:hypothetical protein